MILLIKYSNLIQTIYTQLYRLKYLIMIMILSKWLNSSIWPLDGTLTGAINPGQSGPGSNGNEGVLDIL